MNELVGYRNCFVCGMDSRNGLKVQFELSGRGVRASYTPNSDFEGFKGIVHGGIISALLDEAMWKSVNGLSGSLTMTVKIEVRFKRPGIVGTTLVIEGEVTGKKRRVYETQGVVTDPEGNVIAEATGLFMEVDKEKAARMVEE